MKEEGTPATTRPTPSWLSTDDSKPPVEYHHVWAPRPIGRSILWTPTGEQSDAQAGPYEVFLKQRALEAMYRHTWRAGHADEPFGYLFGDLCEDRESLRRYVVITRAVPSAYPLYEDESQQISPEAARALRRETDRNEGVLAGWYHRHRDGPARLSEEDEATHREYFGEPWHVAFLFVTDPEQPAGGCFQPGTNGAGTDAPLPFYELASPTSLLARGVCKTRLDWQNVETETKVLAEALPRPKAPAETPEPADALVLETVDQVFELEELQPPPEVDLAPAGEVHFDLLPVEDSADPSDFSGTADTDEEDAREAELELVAAVERELAAEADPEPPLVTEVEPELALEVQAEPAAGIEPPDFEDAPDASGEPEPELAAEAYPHPEAAEQDIEAQPEPDPEPVAREAPKAPSSRSRRDERQRHPAWNVAVETVLATAAVASILIGALPLPNGSSRVASDSPDLVAALAGFVMPASGPSPALAEFDDRDPLALPGREVRAAVGRYAAVAEMFGKGRLTCGPLREAHANVDEGWIGYSTALARNRDERSESQGYRDEAVAQAVRDVELDFNSSGCERP